MSTDKAVTEWQDLKSKIKSKWGKLTETEVEGFNGNMHLITDQIQKTYNYTKDKAEQEFKDFKKSLEHASVVAEKAKTN